MRQHLVSHWRSWLLLAVAVVAVNEIVDRNFFDHREHIDGDVLVTVVVVLLTTTVSYAVARMRARRPSTQ